MPFIGIGQETKLSEIISSQIQRDQPGKSYTWISDTPLQLTRTSSLKNVTPKFIGVEFNSDEMTLIGEYVEGNVIQYPTFGVYKIFAEKNIGKNNEEGLIILTAVGLPDSKYSPSGVDEGQKLVISYKIISDTELLLGYDNKRAYFYEIRYDKIK